MKKSLRWMKLDNAAKIYPAAKRKNWTNVYRMSVTLKEEVDPDVLQSALDVAVKRFPSIASRLRIGMFWYYLEEIENAPRVICEDACPLNRMTFKSIMNCAFRVLYYKKRISVEFFHSLCDGTGAMIFTKNLAAEYLRQKHGIKIPLEHEIVDMSEEPQDQELEDSFIRYDGKVTFSKKEKNAYIPRGTHEEDNFLNLVTGIIDTNDALALAKSYNCTLTVLLSAVMMKALYDDQNEKVKNPKRRKSVRVLIPVNLRKHFPSKTMRNFASYITPWIDPQMGEYTLEEMISIIYHRLGIENTKKRLAAKFTANVRSERIPVVRILPLFIKNFVMKLVYDAVGEKKSSICVSNLGEVRLPEVMAEYVDRLDFVLGVQAYSPCNCGVCSYNGKLCINFIRSIKESDIERRFFTELRKMGLHVLVESNQR